MSNEAILIVDDEKEITDLLEIYLKNENYLVRKFYNPLDALAYLENEPVSLAANSIHPEISLKKSLQMTQKSL